MSLRSVCSAVESDELDELLELVVELLESVLEPVVELLESVDELLVPLVELLEPVVLLATAVDAVVVSVESVRARGRVSVHRVRVVGGGLQMREGVMGERHMRGRHAIFEAFPAKGHLPRPPGLAAGRFAQSKDQGLQFLESILHRIVSRNKLVDRSEPKLHLPRAVGRCASERLGRRWLSGSLIDVKKDEQTPALCAGASSY